jgi:hypothetical protein
MEQQAGVRRIRLGVALSGVAPVILHPKAFF